jgi:DNA-binding PadR family transcriptional regulator
MMKQQLYGLMEFVEKKSSFICPISSKNVADCVAEGWLSHDGDIYSITARGRTDLAREKEARKQVKF